MEENGEKKLEKGDKRKVLLVDDDEILVDILNTRLSFEDYDCTETYTAESAYELLQGHRFELILSDMYMPGNPGRWLLQKALKLDPDVAVVMLTGAHETKLAVDCLREGALDYLLKPINLDELVLSVERALERRDLRIQNREYKHRLEEKVKQRTKQLHEALQKVEATYEETLVALVSVLDAREKETRNHSQRVARATTRIARELQLNGDELVKISRGALLHDIGKIGVPDAVLLKPSGLNDNEWQTMKKHPDIGMNIVKDIEFLEGAQEIIYCHHEKMDGSGYPRGLKGEEIPISARIFAVIDAFDAMYFDRPYRKGLDLEAIKNELRRCIGSHFDPKVVEVMLRLLEEEPEVFISI